MRRPVWAVPVVAATAIWAGVFISVTEGSSMSIINPPQEADILFWGQPLSAPSDRPGHAEMQAAAARVGACIAEGGAPDWATVKSAADLQVCLARAAAPHAAGGAAALTVWLKAQGFSKVAVMDRAAGALTLYGTDGPGQTVTATWSAQARAFPFAAPPDGPPEAAGAHGFSVGLTLSPDGRILHTDAAFLRL